MDLFDLYAKITLDNSAYNSGIDSAVSKGESFGGKLKEGLATAAKVGGAAIAAAATGIAALTNASINGYAEYEQLVGGVETLFKASAATVQAYADNAYKTAGLSANEYMSTVTNFSASLLQGLDGDTAAAAVIADRAITDMADNANKMGTSIDMIQNAYQGFAKQNYTMLDNLKLGYGGTATEMARLINESGVLGDTATVTAETVNSVSFDKIIEAIGVVQDRMGVTGTTAKEASSTIQGSISSMQSAWSNFLTGMADDRQNFDMLLENLIDSVLTVGDNIVPRIQTLLPRLVNGVTQLAQNLLPYIPPTLQTLLPTLISGAMQLVSGVAEVLPGIVTAAVASLPEVVKAGSHIIEQLTYGIIDGLPEMIDRLPQVIDDFLDYITGQLPVILDKGVEILGSLAFGIIEAIPRLVEKLPEIIASIAEFFVANFPKIIAKGGELLGKLIAGILGAIPQIAASLPKVIAALVEALQAGWQQIKNAGAYLLEGLWAGIGDKVAWLKSKVTGVIDKIKSWFTGKDGFDEHSPSKWGKTVFENVMRGGEQGTEAGTAGLYQSMNRAIEKVKTLDFEMPFAQKASDQEISSVRPMYLTVVSPDGKALAKFMAPYMGAQLQLVKG